MRQKQLYELVKEDSYVKNDSKILVDWTLLAI